MALYNLIVTSFIGVGLPILFILIVRWLRATRRPPNFPPGPPTRLGLGNFHQIPAAYNFTKVHEWAQEYGAITGLKIGTKNMVIVNNAELVHEFLVKRSALVNARPEVYMAQRHVLPDLWKPYSLLSPPRESKMLRTMGKEYITGAGLLKLGPMQKVAGTRLLDNLVDAGDEWFQKVLDWSLSTPTWFMAGVRPQDLGEDWIRRYQAAQRMFLGYLDPDQSPRADIFPVLRWVPWLLSENKRKAKVTRQALLDTWKPVMDAGRSGRKGSMTPFSSKVLAQAADPSVNFTDDEVNVFIGGLFDATWTSTVMSVNNLVQALASHPEVQGKVQDEIESVFAQDGGSPLALPEHIRIERMPYLSACVMEVLRWRPLSSYVFGPFGLPRETTEDMIVSGYHIPKGTTVVINQWSIAHDEKFYDDPSSFKPERWLKDPVGAKPGVSQPHRKATYSFGMGSRECLGKDYFYQNIKIVFALILWAFDIKPTDTLDTNPSSGYLPSTVLQAKPFKVAFVPRTQDTKEAIAQAKIDGEAKRNELLGL
ncbi:cytochrome P450 [Astrocystis sublimbata]|nr:cytochrome P450 [Astrocystis sublimbata]KAI0192444.1 cytochrome P450 [Astrocystis sublimbata]KAI0192457.1 cytochrome P450 [Astrocystis sublimbata]